jgi:ribosomal protein S19E (S16A)
VRKRARQCTGAIFETLEDSGIIEPTNTRKMYSKQGNAKINRNF